MKRFAIFFTVFAVFFLVSCGGDSKSENETSVDTGDTSDTDTGDSSADAGDTEPTSPTDPTEPTNPGEPTDPTDIEGTTWEAKYKRADAHADAVSANIVMANTRLGLNIFKKLALGNHENMMISPLSISIAMAMTANGTENESLDEMKEVLGYGKMDLPTVNDQFKELIASLVSADKDLILEIADSIWIDEAFSEKIKEEFITLLEDSYDSELFKADFGDNATVGLINSWVGEKTHGRIDNIINSIDPDAVMYLINAIYFKAAWTIAFNKDVTNNNKFFLADGTETEADFMGFRDSDDVQKMIKYGNYVVNGQYVAGVRVPYGRGAFAFYAYVANPDYGTSNDDVLPLDEIIGKIVENGVADYLPSATYKDYRIILPKFKFEYKKSLKDIFKSLGLERIFATGGLTAVNPMLYISEITHKTYIETNEDGTEAAAVTEVVVEPGAAPGEEGPSRFLGFYGRRPFFFFIRDERNGTILFIGKVENPVYDK